MALASSYHQYSTSWFANSFHLFKDCLLVVATLESQRVYYCVKLIVFERKGVRVSLHQFEVCFALCLVIWILRERKTIVIVFQLVYFLESFQQHIRTPIYPYV